MAVYIRTTDFLITHGSGLKRPGSSSACFTPGEDDGRCAIKFSETVGAGGRQQRVTSRTLTGESFSFDEERLAEMWEANSILTGSGPR